MHASIHILIGSDNGQKNMSISFSNVQHTAAVPKLFLIVYHLWALYFHRVPPWNQWKHLVSG